DDMGPSAGTGPFSSRSLLSASFATPRSLQASRHRGHLIHFPGTQLPAADDLHRHQTLLVVRLAARRQRDRLTDRPILVRNTAAPSGMIEAERVSQLMGSGSPTVFRLDQCGVHAHLVESGGRLAISRSG